MIIGADWVLPVARHPIRNGAVVVRASTIADVGPLAEMTARYPDLPVSLHPGCAIVPGLVNAHTHLSLTALSGLVPSMPFSEWLPRIAAATRVLDADDFAAAASAGAIACLRAGVTTVGDIAYGPEAISAAGDVGLSGTFYWEVLGIEPHELERTLERAEFPEQAKACVAGRLRCGISPHAPYTSGPGLLQATWDRARRTGHGYMLHLAESPEEEQLLVRGDGPLAELAARLAHGFEAPRTGAIEYAHRLGVLNGAVAVHCVRLGRGEAELLARHARGVVLCPRSNRYLHNGAPPVAELHRFGAALAVGSDSTASNEGIDLFAEARAVAALDADLEPRRLMAMLTSEGARVLGLDGLIGTLASGKQADLVVLAVRPGEEPTSAVVGGASASDVRAVMTVGVWRVLDGQYVGATEPVARAAERVREKAALAIARYEKRRVG